MTMKEYLNREINKLINTEYGFSIKIFDAEGNSTNQMELTPYRAKHILEWLEKDWSVTVDRKQVK
jgi:hypothetical protein